MAIDLDAVREWPFALQRQRYTEKETILYALSLGYGSDPTREAELRFVFEQGLRAVPTLATQLCHPGFWISDPRTGIDSRKAVHGEHRMRFHAPLPAAGTVRGQTRVTDVIDKGAGKGALLVSERRVYDDESGELLATIEQRTLCRGDGGFSKAPPAAAARSASVLDELAARGPDHRIDIPTLPQAALIHRLCGDMNPLHADPAAARAAGFDRPILHGLCTYGIAARALIEACGDNDPAALKQLSVRFSAVVYPGETVRIEMWDHGAEVHFRAVVPERGVTVVTDGMARIEAD